MTTRVRKRRVFPDDYRLWQFKCKECGDLYVRVQSKDSPPTTCSTACRQAIAGRARSKTKVGDKKTNRAGYVYVKVAPDDPVLAMSPNGSPWMLEHRVVMARKLGRSLTSNEHVHHINGVRTDNRPENLQLTSGAHGAGHVARCADCGSSHIVYEERVLA